MDTNFSSSSKRIIAGMVNKKRKTETVKVSRLGCMRKSTVEVDITGSVIEHVEVWTDEPATRKDRPMTSRDSSSAKGNSS